ncbi:MAG TPA: VCBS repeat-containing protein, partial [bacterium]|nr:VCBS repeat-containing protein [bacterium]
MKGYIKIIIVIIIFISIVTTTSIFPSIEPDYLYIIFNEVSQPAGIQHITPTWGVTWADVNNDGWEDIYINNHHFFPALYDGQTPPLLFLNNGDMTFQNVADDYGILPVGDFHGSAWADFNNDSFTDLFQTQGGAGGFGRFPNRLYKNNGDGTFDEIAKTAGVVMEPARGRTGFWLDYNLDGFLDLYICNLFHPGYPSTLMRNNGDETFTDVGSELGLKMPAYIMG